MIVLNMKDVKQCIKSLEFYAEGSSHFNSQREWNMEWFDPEIGQGTNKSGALARQTLREVESERIK